MKNSQLREQRESGMSQHLSPVGESWEAENHDDGLDYLFKVGIPEITDDEFEQMMQHLLPNGQAHSPVEADEHRTDTDASDFQSLGEIQRWNEQTQAMGQEHNDAASLLNPYGSLAEDTGYTGYDHGQRLKEQGSSVSGDQRPVGESDTLQNLPDYPLAGGSMTKFQAPPLPDHQGAQQDPGESDSKNKSKKKGKVAVIDGVFCVRHQNQWHAATYHHDVRAEVLRQAPPETYDQLPSSGTDELDDKTSYWEPHRHLRFDRREDLPDILLQFLPTKTEPKKPPGILKHNSKIVIDINNRPIRNYPIPFCLSSQIEPARLEFFSRENDNRISKEDFAARMPSVKDKGGNLRPLTTPNSIGMRRLRFRNKAGCLAFESKQGSKERKRALIQCLPKDVIAEVLVSNSLRCFRDLERAEMAYLELANRGSNPEKAGKKRLTEGQRKKLHFKKDQMLEEFQPPNPTAWPYGSDITDDFGAFGAARAFLGLPPLNSIASGEVLNSSNNGHMESDSGGREQQFAVKRHRDDEEHATRDIAEPDASSSTGVKRRRRANLAPVGIQYEVRDGAWNQAVDLRGGEPNGDLSGLGQANSHGNGHLQLYGHGLSSSTSGRDVQDNQSSPPVKLSGDGFQPTAYGYDHQYDQRPLYPALFESDFQTPILDGDHGLDHGNEHLQRLGDDLEETAFGYDFQASQGSPPSELREENHQPSPSNHSRQATLRDSHSGFVEDGFELPSSVYDPQNSQADPSAEFFGFSSIDLWPYPPEEPE